MLSSGQSEFPNNLILSFYWEVCAKELSTDAPGALMYRARAAVGNSVVAYGKTPISRCTNSHDNRHMEGGYSIQ